MWFVVEDQVAARGLYALSGRSRSGKAADSFATDDDFFDVRGDLLLNRGLSLYVALLLVVVVVQANGGCC